MTRQRPRRWLLGGVGVLASAVIAALVWVNRVEIFLVPPVWRDVRGELAALRASGAPRVDGASFSKRLEGRLRELLGLQPAARLLVERLAQDSPEGVMTRSPWKYLRK